MALKSLRRLCHTICWRLTKLLVPALRHSQDIYRDALRDKVFPDTVWLDIGCGPNLLPAWDYEEEKSLVDSCRRVVGLDLDISCMKNHRSISLKTAGDISNLPFKDNTFDLVTANMVVEHLAHPEIQFREIHRILKPDGSFVFHTMNALGYSCIISRFMPWGLKKVILKIIEGREEKDVFPTYYKMNGQRRICESAGSAGFDVERLKMIASTAKLVMFPPLVILELIWIRLSLLGFMEPFRTNILATLRKK